MEGSLQEKLYKVPPPVLAKKRPREEKPLTPSESTQWGAIEPKDSSTSISNLLYGIAVLFVTHTFTTAELNIWKTNLHEKGAAVFSPTIPTDKKKKIELSNVIELWAKYQQSRSRTLVIILSDTCTEKQLNDWSSYIKGLLTSGNSKIHFSLKSWVTHILSLENKPSNLNFDDHKWTVHLPQTVLRMLSNIDENETEHAASSRFKVKLDIIPYSDRNKINESKLFDWILAHCDEVALDRRTALEHLKKMGDIASSFGMARSEVPFLHCPFSREQLVWGHFGKNMKLLRMYPFLNVAVPLVPSTAIEKKDLTSGPKANQWWCTRNSHGPGAGVAGDVYASSTGSSSIVQYEETSLVVFGDLNGGFGSLKNNKTSPHSLGTCIYRSFIPSGSSLTEVPSQQKILALDIDGTLIKPTDIGGVHCNTALDFQEAFEGAYAKVKKFYNMGFKIVLFTNQAGILSGNGITVNIICNRIENLAKKLDVPLQVFISPGGPLDNYRKPAGSMFLLMISRCNGGKQVDMRSSLFVGDMAGREQIGERPMDKNCSDHQFAIVCGLNFKTPEDFFSPTKFQEDGFLFSLGAPQGAVRGTNLNLHITKPLAKLLPLYRARNRMYQGVWDSVRREALIRSLGNLSRLTYKIETTAQVQELINLPCVGPRTVEKIADILTPKEDGTIKGTCEALLKLEKDGSGVYVARAGLMTCPYVGPATAKKLAHFGLMTLDDIRNNKDILLEGGFLNGKKIPKLDPRIYIHLDILDDLKRRVPRRESEHVLQLIRDIVDPFAPGSMVIMGGSYRRGSPDSSDLDVIISGPENKLHSPMTILRHLWSVLKKHPSFENGNFLPSDISTSDDLTGPIPGKPDPLSKLYMGIFKDFRNPSSLHRRMDIKICDFDYWTASAHAWTGNTQLNRTMKQFISNLHYSLNDKYIARDDWKKADHSNRVPVRTVDVRCEFELFSFFGLRFIPPTERNVLAVLNESGDAEQMANKTITEKEEIEERSRKKDDQDKIDENPLDDAPEYIALGIHVDDFVPEDFILNETEEEKRIKEALIEKARKEYSQARENFYKAVQDRKEGRMEEWKL
jgi:DNA 3'-phosphatase